MLRFRVFSPLLEERVRKVFEEEGKGIQSLLLIQSVVFFVVAVAVAVVDVDFVVSLINKLTVRIIICISGTAHFNVGILEFQFW